MKLNCYGRSYFNKLIGSSYNLLQGDYITTKEISLPKGLNENKFKRFIFVELNKENLGISDYITNKYLLIALAEDKFVVYENYNSKKFNNAIKKGEYDYSSNHEDISIKLLTKNYNVLEVLINFNTANFRKEDLNLFNVESFLIKYKQNKIRYCKYLVDSGQYINIGLYDADFNGRIEENVDFFFCGRIRDDYFFVDGINKYCNKISKNNYLIYDSLNVFDIQLVSKRVDSIILRKTNTFDKNILKSNSISLIKHAPFNMFFVDSALKQVYFSELFNRGKYVYIDIWTEFCPPCISNLPVLDSLNAQYSDRLLIISLLDKDDHRVSLQRLKQVNNITHYLGWASEEICFELLLYGYPHGILFNDKGEFINFMKVKELVKYCNDTISKQ